MNIPQSDLLVNTENVVCKNDGTRRFGIAMEVLTQPMLSVISETLDADITAAEDRLPLLKTRDHADA